MEEFVVLDNKMESENVETEMVMASYNYFIQL